MKRKLIKYILYRDKKYNIEENIKEKLSEGSFLIDV